MSKEDKICLRKTNDFGTPRLTSASCGTSLRLQGKKINYIDNIDSTNKIKNNATQNLWESTLSFRYALNQSI